MVKVRLRAIIEERRHQQCERPEEASVESLTSADTSCYKPKVVHRFNEHNDGYRKHNEHANRGDCLDVHC